jgi:hypothetical protein
VKDLTVQANRRAHTHTVITVSGAHTVTEPISDSRMSFRRGQEFRMHRGAAGTASSSWDRAWWFGRWQSRRSAGHGHCGGRHEKRGDLWLKES